MPVAISVTADGESPIIALLEHLIGYDKKAMFDEIGAYGVSSSEHRFINQSDVDGNPWKQSWRAKLQGGETGRDTGQLLSGLHHNVLANGVEWGSDKEYSIRFHFGAHIVPKTAQYLVFNVGGNWRKVKEVTNPPRSFLGINKEDDESILNIIGRHLSG
ncbi:virion morphogenesis protein [Acinetobacter sp. AG1]|uniref:phage virion morphogenesis protein n=1 Tax=Acinetobacter sp. AG1 TaxID=348388 RepID=UPI000629591E|nr:phage virion morphogenesis protein [Acinetobacter sp. AG1]KKW81542.1 virion morphogenesis protein [Acinetobacter sp. AG1]